MKVIAVLLILLGIAAGLYIGIYKCFIGGIVDIIDQVKADVTDSSKVAWGVAKIVFSGVVTTIAVYVLVIPGIAVFIASEK